MAKLLGGRQTVPLEEVVLAHVFQFQALLDVLDRKGVIHMAAVLEEIKSTSAALHNGTLPKDYGFAN
jgi:hypothetical protein